MNYQAIIDQFLPNQFEVKTDWVDPDTDELAVIAFFSKGQRIVSKLPQFIIYQIDLSEISLRRSGTVFDFAKLEHDEYVLCNSTGYDSVREAFVELLRYILNLQLDSLFDDPNK